MKNPHTPAAATRLFDLAGHYCDACDEGNEFAAADAAKGMLEALQSGHAHDHLKLLIMDVEHARRLQEGSQVSLVSIPLSVYLEKVKPILDALEDHQLPPPVSLPSFATRIWPRATVN